jgi:hypothetical protein
MGNLIHNKIGIFEKAEHSVVKFNTHIIFVFLKAERTEEEIFHPMIIQIFDEVILCRD